MTFLEILNKSKLDLTNAILVADASMGGHYDEFDFKPKDFLRFAKEDLANQTNKGLINSLTNSKRAIDCQVDEALSRFGVHDKDEIQCLTNFLNYFDIEEELTWKLKLIQALNLAPSLLVSQTRTLRNKLEHEYRKPPNEEVENAADIAELFIKAISHKVLFPETDFFISDKDNHKKGTSFTKVLSIKFKLKKHEFNIILKQNNDPKEKMTLGKESSAYLGLLRLMNSIDDEFEAMKSYKIILDMIGHSMPNDKAKLKHY